MVDIANAARAALAQGDRDVVRSDVDTTTTSHNSSSSWLDAVDDSAWQRLCDNAVEPNGYYLPAWMRAVNGTGDASRRTTALTAFDAGVSQRLIGLLPVISAWRAYRLPLPVLVSADPYRSLDTPLLDRDHADAAAAGLLTQARAAGAHALIIRLLPLEGAAAQALTRAAQTMGPQPVVLNRYRRACLDATADAEQLLRGALGGKKMKELRRLQNRLAAHGEVVCTIAREPDVVAAAFDVFLQLEASGWKGRRGTAMAQRADVTLVRNAAIDLAARGQCEIITLHAGATAVAAGIVLRHLDRAFFFKLGVDERFAGYSPGVQLTLALTRHLCADPAITMADSTASPDHPMIDPIWRGRLEIGDVLIPLYRRDPLVALIHGAILLRETARGIVLRMLGTIRRLRKQRR